MYLFCQCYNPKASIRLKFLKFRPYTTHITYGETIERIQLGHWIEDYIKLKKKDEPKKNIDEAPEEIQNATITFRYWIDDSLETMTFLKFVENSIFQVDAFGDSGQSWESSPYKKHIGTTRKWAEYVTKLEAKRQEKELRNLRNKGECLLADSSEDEDSDDEVSAYVFSDDDDDVEVQMTMTLTNKEVINVGGGGSKEFYRLKAQQKEQLKKEEQQAHRDYLESIGYTIKKYLSK